MEPVHKQDECFILIKRNTYRIAHVENYRVQKCLLGRV